MFLQPKERTLRLTVQLAEKSFKGLITVVISITITKNVTYIVCVTIAVNYLVKKTLPGYLMDNSLS